MKKERLSAEVVNTLYPVSGVRVHRGVVVVKRLCTIQIRPSQHKKKGQQIMYLSRRSLNNFAFYVSTTEVRFMSLLTLSYGANYPKDGKQAKADLTRMLTWLKRKYKGLEYFWFLEFQERGAPHFHVGLNIAHPGDVGHAELALAWSKICCKVEYEYSYWKEIEYGLDYIISARGGSVRDDVARQHRRAKVWENVRSVDGAIRYVLSYALKPYQKTVPADYRNVGRFWGLSAGVGAGVGADFRATESEVRALMVELGRDMAKFDVLPKYLFHSGDLTQIFRKYTIE